MVRRLRLHVHQLLRLCRRRPRCCSSNCGSFCTSEISTSRATGHHHRLVITMTMTEVAAAGRRRQRRRRLHSTSSALLVVHNDDATHGLSSSVSSSCVVVVVVVVVLVLVLVLVVVLVVVLVIVGESVHYGRQRCKWRILPSSSSSASASWCSSFNAGLLCAGRGGARGGQEEWLEDAATLLKGAARWLPIAEKPTAPSPPYHPSRRPLRPPPRRSSCFRGSTGRAPLDDFGLSASGEGGADREGGRGALCGRPPHRLGASSRRCSTTNTLAITIGTCDRINWLKGKEGGNGRASSMVVTACKPALMKQ